MARIRTIKPEAFQSETLSQVSLAAERTFFGLLTQADDQGRMKDQSAVLNGVLWPLRPEHTVSEMESDLKALTDVGLLCRYTVEDRGFIHVVSFRDHQRINRPTPTKIPPCPTHGGPAAEDNGQGNGLF